MTRALSPRKGEQRERKAGKGQAVMAPSLSHPQLCRITGEQQNPAAAGQEVMVCWDMGSPSQTAAVPPGAAQRESLNLPSPKSSS